MDVKTFDIAGLIELAPVKHGDGRGYFTELYRDDVFDALRAQAAGHAVPPARFIQENQSLSVRQGTIRGLHFQTRPMAQGKLVRCVSGAIFDVAVDLRTDSPTFGQYVAVTLDDQSCNQLWIPSGFAHGFCTLTPNAVVAYRVTAHYSRDHDKGVAWDDPDLGIAWPDCRDPETISPKDRVQPALRALPDCFRLED